MSTIDLIKKLRIETNASIVSCKEALLKTNNNYDEAKKIILATKKEETKSNRVASKGLCYAVIHNNTSVFYEINAETDFISKNEDFIHLVQLIGERTIHSNIKTISEVLAFQIEEHTISEHIEQMKNKLSEQIILRRYYRIEKKDHQVFGLYNHLGKSICVLIMEGGNEILANEMAKQVIANQIEYLDIRKIDQETLEFEKKQFNSIQSHQTFEQFLESKSLLHSNLYNKPNVTVDNELVMHQAEVIDFFKLELGMGIIGKLNCILDLTGDLNNITVTPIILKHNKL
jgi:elongation factor Ts